MLLVLGSSTVDVADRALVVAVLPAGPAEAVVAAARRATDVGADLVEVAGREVGAVGPGVPVAVRAAHPEEVLAAIAAGTTAICPVPVSGDAGSVVPGLREAAARLAAAGVDLRRAAVEPVPAAGGRVVLPRAPGVRCVGAPVLVSVMGPDAGGVEPGAVAGALSVAVVRGCGLVRVAAADVGSARRVVDVIAAVRRGRAG